MTPLTPTSNDNGQWLAVAQGVISLLLAGVVTLYWRLWGTLATKLWVAKAIDEMKKEIQAEDVAQDLSLAKAIDQIIAAQALGRSETKTELENYRRELGQRLDRLEDRVLDTIMSGRRPKP